MSKLVVLAPPIVPTPADRVIIVDELVTEGHQELETWNLRISPTNRKRFNEEALLSMAANVKQYGILQHLLVRPVKPTAELPQRFEIVAGERRFRSAVLAGLTTVPVRIKYLTDVEAAVIQLLENIQREDPHPLEEAEGYQSLMHTHCYTIEQLIEHTKKSRAYIYARLKLCALSLDAREAFLDDKVPASTALLIARIPTPGLQSKALKEILTPQHNGEPMSYRQAATILAQRYTLDLSTAPFDVKDTKLLATAGNCTKCPKRTGNQPEVYSDAKSANVCTDPDCFAEKKAAHHQRLIVIANKTKVPVLEGDDANRVRSNAWSSSAEFVLPCSNLWTFERILKSAGMSGTVESRLDRSQLPEPVQYIKENGGVVTPVFRRADVQAVLERHGICETEQARAERIALEEADPEAIAARKKQYERDENQARERTAIKRKAAAMTAERVALYRKFRKSAQEGLPLLMLRELAKLMIRDDMNEMSLPDDLIGDLYPFDRDDDAACAFIDKADAPTVQLLIMDLVIGEGLSVSTHFIEEEESEPDVRYLAVQAAAKSAGIEIDEADLAATTAALAVSEIDVDDLESADDVLEIIKENEQYLAAACAYIIDKAPHHLGNVQAAANSLGYFYGTEGWQKKEASEADDAPAIAEPAEGPANAPGPRKTIKLKPKAEDSKQAAGPLIKVKKDRAAQAAAALTPAEAWPFPTTSIGE